MRTAPPRVVYVITVALNLWLSSVAFGQSTAAMNGSFTAGNINNAAQVDGVANTSVAGAVGSSQCAFGSNPSSGCVIWDGFNEAPFQAWPLLGGHFYRLNMGHGTPSTINGVTNDGTWWTTVPIVLSTSQLMGSGRINAAEAGSSGTIFRACDGAASCVDLKGNRIYFPNAPPPLTAPLSGTLAAGGSLLQNTTYYWQIAWVVNLATGPDSKSTSSQPAYPVSGTAVYAGYAVNDLSTNCPTGNPCTWMALNAKVVAGSAPSWTGSAGQKVTDSSGITWLNIGYFNATSGPFPYGAPGLSVNPPATEGSKNTGTQTNPEIKLNGGSAINLGSYPNCSTSGVSYTNGQLVLGPSGVNSHLYLAVGTNTTTSLSCNMSTGAGSQTPDGSNSPTCATGPPAGTNCLYWQEVGPVTSPLHLPVVGFVVYASTSSGTETGAPSTGCSSTVQVGTYTACAIGATYTLTTLTCGTGCTPLGNGAHVPMADTTHPLVVLGEKQSMSGLDTATFMTRAQDLTADANIIAGEACLYLYAQEESGCYSMQLLSGSEAIVAAIGPGGSDSMLWDFIATNPGNEGFQQQRVAGVFLDARDGEPLRMVLNGSVVPYNSPAEPNTNSIPYGIWFIGGTDVTIESVHTEAVQYGIYCQGNQTQAPQVYAGCWILSTDPGGGPSITFPESAAVRLGQNVGTGMVNVVLGNAQNALEDDTVATSPISYSGSGTYILGQYDIHGGSRMTLVPQPGSLQVFDGPLFLNNGSTSPTNAGALGFAQGTDVSGTSFPTASVVMEAPNSIPSSYFIQLPPTPASGVLQSSSVFGSALVTSSFSGDTNHSKHFPDQTSTISGTCSVSLGSCNVQGLYRLSFYLYSTTTSCSGGNPAVGPIQVSYTDRSGSKSVNVPLFSSGTITSSISLSGSAYAWGTATIWSTGTQPIQYQTLNYANCGTGTAKYELDATVEQIQ